MVKRTEQERRAAYSAKMTWLTNLCAMATVTDAAFRILYALIVKFRDNDTDATHPKDEWLGKACAKSGRTVRRITAALEAERILDKKKTALASQYTFYGLDRPTLTGQSDEGPANLGQGTGQVGSRDRPPVGRTEPSVKEPSGESTLSQNFLNGEEKKKEVSRKKKDQRTPLPANPIFSSEAKQIAADAGVDSEAAPRDWERFVCHHQALGSRFVDWGAAWRKWCLNYNASLDGVPVKEAHFRRVAGELTYRSRTQIASDKIAAELAADEQAPAPIAITAAGRSITAQIEGGGWWRQKLAAAEKELERCVGSAERKRLESNIARYRARAEELEADAERKKASSSD